MPNPHAEIGDVQTTTCLLRKQSRDFGNAIGGIFRDRLGKNCRGKIGCRLLISMTSSFWRQMIFLPRPFGLSLRGWNCKTEVTTLG
jgi:hypothetical protein